MTRIKGKYICNTCKRPIKNFYKGGIYAEMWQNMDCLIGHYCSISCLVDDEKAIVKPQKPHLET